MKTNLRRLALGVFAALLVTALLAVLVNRPSDRSSPDIAFSQLLADVDKDRVREVVIQGPSIHGTYTDGRGFSTYAPNDPTPAQRLYAKGVTVIARPREDDVPWFVALLVSWLPFIALIGVWIFLSRHMRRPGGNTFGFGKKCTISDKLLDSPKHWRDHADDARALAERLADRESKHQMLEIADGYEFLARRIEKRGSSTPG